MREVNLGALKVRAQGGPGALTFYQREFKDNGKRYDWYADQEEIFSAADAARNACIEAGEDDGDVIASNYIAALEPLFLLRTLWACVKNADESTQPFDEWHKSLAISMSPVAGWKWEVWLLIQAELFREPKTEENPEAEEEPEK